MREVETLATVRRMEADLEHLRERHTEQIERLEDFAREFILALEELRSGALGAGRPPSARAADEDSG
jgi:hypothetical protein